MIKRHWITATLVFSCLFSLSVYGQSEDTTKLLTPEAKFTKEAMVVTNILEKYHYRRIKLTDSLSSVIFDNYFSSLDPNRVYFLQSDVDKFEPYRFKMDNFLKSGQLEVPFEIFNTFRGRFMERINHVERILEGNFDFTIDEYYQSDRSEEPWASDANELNQIWRKTIKTQALNLKLAGKELGEALGVLNKRYARFRKAISQYNSGDVFQQFMNAYSTAYDPHTNYFLPITSENLMIDITKSLEGIGARLGTDGDYTIVASIVAGGPAFKSNQIHENDRISGVAQGEDGKFVDIIGWRVTDVVQLIRGPKGTVVRLQIIPASEPVTSLPIVVRLVRDKIKLEDEKVTSKIIPFKDDGASYNLGVITIPSFYLDFDDYRKGVKDYNSTSRDVRAILEEFKETEVDGVLIDLRRNGGGALQEAIELTGLFIKDGPVVQVKDNNGDLELYKDPDPKIVYEGPLAVLINRFSASASEIFTGAIQDYKRGVIIGEQSYGKGTVQNPSVFLKRFIKDEEDVGILKVTFAKYYRVNGSSTQNLGVTPDIELPSAYSADIFGESSRPSALPWDEIKSANYNSIDYVDNNLVVKLRSDYNQRLKTDPELQNLIEQINESKANRSKNIYSLQEVKRKEELDAAENRREARNKIPKVTINPESKESDTILNLDDPYLKEGIMILAEIIAYNIG